MEQQVARGDRVVFYIVTMLYWFSMYTYVPILGPYVQYIGGSLSMVGLVVGSYGVTQMLVRIPLGIMSDRMGKRKPFVTLGLVLTLVSSLGLGFSRSPVMALVFRGLAGLGAGSWVAFSVLYSSYFPPQQAAQAMGVITFYMTLGQTAATAIGGILTDYFGWASSFFVGGAAAAVGLILSVKILERKSVNTEPIQLGDLGKVGTNRQLLKVSFLAIILQALTFSTVNGFSPNYATSLGASGTQLSILALVSALPAAIASLLSGKWASKYGERAVLMTALAVFAAGVWAIPLSPTLPILYLTQSIGAIGRGAAFPILMGLSIKSIAMEHRATAMGFFQSIYALGMTVGPVAVGVIGDAFGLKPSFMILGLVGMSTAALAGVWCSAGRARGSA